MEFTSFDEAAALISTQGSNSGFPEALETTIAPISSQTTDVGAAADDSVRTSECVTGFELGSTGNMRQEIDVEPLKEESSLFLSDTDGIDSSRPLKNQSLHNELIPGDENLNSSCAPQVAEASIEAMLEPVMNWVTQQSSQQYENNTDIGPQTMQPYNSNGNQFPMDPIPAYAPERVEDVSAMAPAISLEPAREAKMEVAAKSKKARRKTGPRPKSAKEWFAKRAKDVQQPLPEATGMKRKRSKKDRDAKPPPDRKRKRSRKPRADKSGKKTRRDEDSMKAMAVMFESLRSNPIEARIAFGDLPEADPIVATMKGDQLQQIMKGLPKDIDKQIVAKDKKKLDDATRSFGLNNCVARDGKWLVKGMRTSLHAHQVIGTSWMLSRELCNDGPSGGILADEMGMGKTLQTLACIVSNPPSKDGPDKDCRTTLIIAPATAIEQWESEIEKHTDSSYIDGVLHYKQSKKLPIQALNSMSIILASYQEISRQFPGKKLITRLKEESHNDGEFAKMYNNNLGMLFQMEFWRVVLDESQNIKNDDSQTSIACQNINARYCWALSGTPITNSVDGRTRIDVDENSGSHWTEIYPYLKFLKVKVPNKLKEFRSLYTNTKDDDEGHLLRQASLRDPYGSLQRETVMKNDLKEEDLKEIQSRLSAIRGSQPVFKRIGKWCAKRAKAIIATKDQETSESKFGNSKFGYEFNINKQLDLALASKQENVCRICYQQPIKAQTGQCGHIFCEECLVDHIRDELRNGHIIPKCLDCKKSLTDYEPLAPSDREESDFEDSITETASRVTISRGQRLGLDSFKKHPKLKKSQSMFLQQCDQAHPEPVVPSAKTTAVKATILKWLSEAPDDKIIVFMEFKMTGAIIGRMLEAEGIPFLYFFGDMEPTGKQHAIQGFHEKSEIKVLIASMRCGSVALNLTIANRVIIVDLWWNLAIEYQAFGRVFRIGQTKETYFTRIVADGTLDNRMEAIQEKKEENISKIMESGGKKELSIEEALSLFGRVKKSADGTLQVLPDDDDDDEYAEEAEVGGET
ncbi:hypothetical protein E0Z10_g8005 [Xylaria hypoxylon]|uniref:RING-type domain-containing protein n=1 Tax=Xylaria hypoxylon TaxID=37992 RepID=A0A4Z0YNQ0_9PEZI|nr:hypothetical protein E0Z10_g8005 [Xylaria hypoxylon]